MLQGHGHSGSERDWTMSIRPSRCPAVQPPWPRLGRGAGELAECRAALRRVQGGGRVAHSQKYTGGETEQGPWEPPPPAPAGHPRAGGMWGLGEVPGTGRPARHNSSPTWVPKNWDRIQRRFRGSLRSTALCLRSPGPATGGGPLVQPVGR